MRKFLIILLGMQIALIGAGVWQLIEGHTAHGLFNIIVNSVCGLLNIQIIKKMDRW